MTMLKDYGDTHGLYDIKCKNPTFSILSFAVSLFKDTY